MLMREEGIQQKDNSYDAKTSKNMIFQKFFLRKFLHIPHLLWTHMSGLLKSLTYFSREIEWAYPRGRRSSRSWDIPLCLA